MTNAKRPSKKKTSKMPLRSSFIQTLFFDLQGYSKKIFLQDLSAGITVGIVALPLSLALAIATGVPPIYGLYTAGIAGLAASIFAGSPYSVSGPAAAMVPILVGIIDTYGLENLPAIGILAGILLILFGVLKVGKLITKIPEAIVLGFTFGVAVVIFFGQLNSFLGLKGIHPHEHFHEKALETLTHISKLQMPTLIIGAITLIIITQLHKIHSLKKVPPTLPAVALATIAVAALPGFSTVATVESAYGAVVQGFPSFLPERFTGADWINASYIVPAFKIAALIAIESLLCAMVADKMTKTRHRPNQELAAQGVANIVSPLFMGIPATAVIARTGTIIKADAKTRIAASIHALVVILFFVVLAPVASSIPLTALAAVLLVTAVRISEYQEVLHSLKNHALAIRSVLATTLMLTIFTDLVIGVSAGLAVFAGHKLYDRYVAHIKTRDETLSDVAEHEARDIESGVEPVDID